MLLGAFGDFDTRFLGVSLDIAHEHSWDDLRRWTLSPAEPDLDELVDMDDEPFLRVATAMSVLAHEGRHFHDFLVSPFGAMTAARRVSLGVNSLATLAYLQQLPDWDVVTVVPAPLSRWCRMDKHDRSGFVDPLNELRAQRGMAALRLPDLPVIAGDISPTDYLSSQDSADITVRLEGVIRGCTNYAEQLDNAMRLPAGLPDTGFGSRTLWEMSAFLVQLSELHKSCDTDVASRFMEIAWAAESQYARGMSALVELARQLGVQPSDSWMARVVGWCLLGEPRSNPYHSHPVVRFAALGAALLDDPQLASAGSTVELFGQWDDLTGQEATLDHLVLSLDIDQAVLEKIERQAVETHGSVDASWATKATFEYFAAFAKAREHMVREVVDDPDTYFEPYEYLSSMDQWSTPPIKLSAPDDRGLQFDAEAQELFDIYRGHRLDDGSVLVQVASPLGAFPGVRHVATRTAFDAFSLFSLSDCLFGSHTGSISEVEWREAQMVVGDDKRLVRVIWD